MFNRSDIVKNNLSLGVEEKMWTHLSKGEIVEYFKIHEDKILKNQFKYDVNLVRVPVSFYVSGSDTIISRAVSVCLTLAETITTVFTHIHDPDTLKLLPEYSNLKVKIAGAEMQMSTSLFYLYQTFKCVDGVLHLTLIVK